MPKFRRAERSSTSSHTAESPPAARGPRSSASISLAIFVIAFTPRFGGHAAMHRDAGRDDIRPQAAFVLVHRFEASRLANDRQGVVAHVARRSAASLSRPLSSDMKPTKWTSTGSFGISSRSSCSAHSMDAIGPLVSLLPRPRDLAFSEPRR